jgi:hypothetical protein
MNISIAQIRVWLDQIEQFMFARWVCLVWENGLMAICGYLTLKIRWNWFLLFDPVKDGIREFLAFGQGSILGLMVGVASGFLAGLALGVLSLLAAINEKNIR